MYWYSERGGAQVVPRLEIDQFLRFCRQVSSSALSFAYIAAERKVCFLHHTAAVHMLTVYILHTFVDFFFSFPHPGCLATHKKQFTLPSIKLLMYMFILCQRWTLQKIKDWSL